MAVDEECFTEYTKLQKKGKHRAIIYRITDDNKKIRIVDFVEKGDGTPEEEFNKFAKRLTVYDCAYAVYDAEFVSKTGSKQAKLCFLLW